MGKTKKLMQQSILLAADSVMNRIKESEDAEKAKEYADAMFKMAMAWKIVKEG